MKKIQFTEYEDRNSALWIISQAFSKNGITIDSDLRNISDLRKFLKERWGKAPNNLKTMEALETVAHKLGIDGARNLIDLFPPEPPLKPKKERKTPVNQKRRVSVEEIKRLKTEGKSLRDVANIAGISRERVRQIICKNNI